MSEEKKFKPIKRPRWTQWRKVAQHITAHCAIEPFHFFYSRFSHTGRENIAGHKGPFLVVSNHLSYYDPPLMVVSTGIPLAFMAKVELNSSPILKPIMDFYGTIIIDRDKPSLSTIRTVKEAFQSGWSVGIFIEGTRNKTPGVLGKPHIGAAYFAWANKVPIIPLGLVGTNVKWGKARGAVGPIIQPSADLEATTWEIMESLSKLTGWELPERTELLDQESAHKI
jgi:1-acyl-sn-glycerol-3-phosphate acyltransferase